MSTHDNPRYDKERNVSRPRWGLQPLDEFLDENRQWIQDWMDGYFSSTSRDDHGWPMEMHGLVQALEDALNRLEGDPPRSFVVEVSTELLAQMEQWSEPLEVRVERGGRSMTFRKPESVQPTGSE